MYFVFKKAQTSFAILLICATCVRAQEIKPSMQICQPDTTFVGRVDATVVDWVLKELPKVGDLKNETVIENKLRRTKEIIGDDSVWVSANWPTTPTRITLSISDADGTRVSRLLKLWNFNSSELYRTKTVTVSLASINKVDEKSESVAADDWESIFATSRQEQIIFAARPPKYFYKVVDELLDELPDYLGGGPTTLLTEGTRSVSISVDPTKAIAYGLIHSKNDDAAKRLSSHLSRLLPTAVENISFGNAAATETIRNLANAMTFTAKGHQVQIQFRPDSEFDSSKLLRQMFRSILVATSQSQREKLRNAALGILNFESAHGTFPPPSKLRANRKKGLSWRVHILPFIGEFELWQKFKLDEPWDSPANKKLLPEMPELYDRFTSRFTMPADAPTGMTTLLAPISDRTILGSPKKVGFGNISDGSSNTILLVVVKDSIAVPWTAPQDYEFDPDNPASGLRFENGKATFVMCDGSVQVAKRGNPWVSLFEMNDGEVAEIGE